MPGMNLTRDEAAQRSALIAVDSYEVELDLTVGDTVFMTTSTVRFSCREPGASTWIDLVAPQLDAVTLNGTALDVAAAPSEGRIDLPALREDNVLTVRARGAYSRTGEGLHRMVDPVDDQVYCYSQFETADARRAFACFDQPDLKATFTFTIVADARWTVLSNAPTPPAEPLDGGAAKWSFGPTARMSTYITAICAGGYHAVHDTYPGRGSEIPLGLYCRRSLAAHLDADAIFEVTKQGFGFFEATFAYPYPFVGYDQVFVPEYNAGAMENAGCVTFTEEFVFRSRVTDAAYERRAEVILHEMAHMWFGDLVTMRWWNDLWLNESFAAWAAVFSQSRATRWSNAWTTFANTEKLWALRQDQLPTTHPIASEGRDLEEVELNFDGITYAKGASVLKQLVAYVGEEAFFAGLRTYFRTYAYANASLRDLFACLESTSGRDLDAWERAWLHTSGVTTLQPEITPDGAGGFDQVAIRQTPPAAHPHLRPHRIAVGLYEDSVDGLQRRERHEVDLVGELTPVPVLAGGRQPDLLLVNDDDLTFAKVRLDERSLATLMSSIPRLTDSLPRSLCWTAATDMLRDAELRARDFVALVLRGVGQESELTVVQSLLAYGRVAVDLYSDPGSRPAAQRQWAEAMRALMLAAAPGSDHQLALTRAWIAAALGEAHVADLRGLLDGTKVPDGLVVDVDLRWAATIRLAALGALDAAAIEAEQALDATTKGRQQAAHAMAARPLMAAKQAAWEATVVTEGLPNAELLATLRGFVQHNQPDLLRQFREPYFAAVADVWRARTPKMAENIIEVLFPRALPEPETLQRANDWLAASSDAPPAVRRLVAEGAADVQRALRAQERDRRD